MLEVIIARTGLVVVAFALDLIMGHRQLYWQHPVCYVGKLINFLEPLGRDFGAKINNVRIAGILCLALSLLIVGFFVFILINLPYIGWFFLIYFSYSGLATKSLFTFFYEVLEKVEHGNIEQAQKSVAQLVSRDTTVLKRNELRKTLGDTFSENFTDAIVAPLFWLLIGGPIGLWLYKTVSTMDSMWGYKTQKWLELGFAGAKADDLLAYIPARLSVLFLYFANKLQNITLITGGSWPGWRFIFNQASGMPSPNSGLPMASAAWLMNARLGGPSIYFNEMVDKPWLGPPDNIAKAWDDARLKHLATITLAASYVALWIMVSFFFSLFMFLHIIYG